MRTPSNLVRHWRNGESAFLYAFDSSQELLAPFERLSAYRRAQTPALGGGVEWALPYNNLSVKVEYMFIGLGDHHDTLTTCGTAIAPAGNAVGGGPFCFNHDFSGIHTAKIGLNYRFGPSVRPY